MQTVFSNTFTEKYLHNSFKVMAHMKEKADRAYQAILNNDTEAIGALINDRKFCKARRIFPLHIAVEYQNIRSIRTILGFGYYIDRSNCLEGTALHLALIRKHYKAAIYLAQKGSSLYKRNKNGENALSLVARHGNESVIKYLVRLFKGPSYLFDLRYGPRRTTLLGLLTLNRNIGVTAVSRELLTRGASLEKPITMVTSFYESQHFLTELALGGDNKLTSQILMDVIKLSWTGKLVKTFDPNMRDEKGNTLIHYLALRGCLNGVTLLIEFSSVWLDVKNDDAQTPLNMAIKRGHPGVIKCLINAGCDINQTTLWCGVTPFDQAMYDEFHPAARILLKAGFNVKKSNHYSKLTEKNIKRFNLRDEGVPTLAKLAVGTIRNRILGCQGRVSIWAVTRLNLPTSLQKTIFPFSSDHGRRWTQRLRRKLEGLLPGSGDGKYQEG